MDEISSEPIIEPELPIVDPHHHLWNFSQPAHAQAVAHIEQVAAARGKILGTAPHPGYPLEALAVRGHRHLIMDDDVSLIREAMSAQVTKAQSCL